jgi:hypothetical protein
MFNKDARSALHVLLLAFDRLSDTHGDHDKDDKGLDQMVHSKVLSGTAKIVREDRLFVIIGSGRIEAGNIVTGKDLTEELKALISEVVILNV